MWSGPNRRWTDGPSDAENRKWNFSRAPQTFGPDANLLSGPTSVADRASTLSGSSRALPDSPRRPCIGWSFGALQGPTHIRGESNTSGRDRVLLRASTEGVRFSGENRHPTIRSFIEAAIHVTTNPLAIGMTFFSSVRNVRPNEITPSRRAVSHLETLFCRYTARSENKLDSFSAE